MTLVLYLPYDNGILLLSDKMVAGHNPKYDYEKIKIITKNDIDLIFAGSGDKGAFEKIIERVENDIDSFNSDIISIIDNFFKEFLRNLPTDLLKKTRNTEFFVFKKNGNDWEGFIISEGGVRNLSMGENFAIGLGKYAIVPQLEIETFFRNIEDVKFFGLNLMKYSSINFETKVGDPEKFGCDLIQFKNNNDYISNFNHYQDYFEVERMLYRFDDENEQ